MEKDDEDSQKGQNHSSVEGALGVFFFLFRISCIGYFFFSSLRTMGFRLFLMICRGLLLLVEWCSVLRMVVGCDVCCSVRFSVRPASVTILAATNIRGGLPCVDRPSRSVWYGDISAPRHGHVPNIPHHPAVCPLPGLRDKEANRLDVKAHTYTRGTLRCTHLLAVRPTSWAVDIVTGHEGFLAQTSPGSASGYV